MSLTGRLLRIIRVAEPPRRVTDDEWRELLERSAPLNVTAAQRARIMAAVQARRPATYPAYRRVRVDAARRVWIADYHNRQLWTVFDSTGSVIGRLELPAADPAEKTDLAGIERDHIVVYRRDEDGAPHLTFHRFTIGPAGR